MPLAPLLRDAFWSDRYPGALERSASAAARCTARHAVRSHAVPMALAAECSIPVVLGEHPPAVVLFFVDPAGAVEGLAHERGGHRDLLRDHWMIMRCRSTSHRRPRSNTAAASVAPPSD